MAHGFADKIATEEASVLAEALALATAWAPKTKRSQRTQYDGII